MGQPSAARNSLDRVLSRLGYCSRSRALELIRSGRVTVNGSVQRHANRRVSSEKDHIRVDGQPVAAPAGAYWMMNKPRGLVTTTSDEQGRSTVYSLFPAAAPWVSPVGRLDKASEGLLLFTNDTVWADRIASPQSHLDKTYHVQVAARLQDSDLQAMTTGVRAATELLRFKQAAILRQGGKNTWIEVVLDEGRNRQIRRVLEALGLGVLRLVRVAIGPLVLGNLGKGQVRPLSGDEKKDLDRALSIRRNPKR